MITYKHIDKIIFVVVAAAVILCFTAMVFADDLTGYVGGNGVSMEYESKLFDTDSPILVNIIMDEADWEKMLANAMQETYYQCDVQIGGQTFYRVGIRPKGNTSLSSIASNPDTDRYSFKLEFDQFVEGQTCYGLDKLALNNNYADATNMKEALIYDMYRYIGADASLYNYASVSVNGEFWGVYIALEAVEDSFLLRNYGASGGELYKPDSMDFGAGKKGGFDFSNKDGDFNPFDKDGGFDFSNKDGDFNPSAKGGGFGGFSMGGNGANLNYTDDDLDSYSSIWDGEVTKTNKADHKRVVEALKNISEGTELEKYMDIDNLLRYMAVHVFSVNSDSLTGMMAHNYYLYEKNGQLNMLPWDYNLALGGMGGGGSASGTINDAIDGAFSGTKFFDSLMEDETYYGQYHAYLRQLVEGYINGGAFDEFYTHTRGILDELVKEDPTAFYSYEEYSDAADTLYQVVKLRGQSIEGQLDGTIPSTESGQRQDGSSLIDTGDLDLSIMGSMDMGNGAMGGGGGFRGFGGGFNFGGGFVGGSGFEPSQFGREKPEEFELPQFNGEKPEGFDSSQFGGGKPEGFELPQFNGDMPEGFDPTQFNGDMPEGFESSQFNGEKPEGFEPSQFNGEVPDGFNPFQTDRQDKLSEKPSSESGKSDGEKMDFGGVPGAASGNGPNIADGRKFMPYGISFILIIGAFLFAKLYKQRSIRR